MVAPLFFWLLGCVCVYYYLLIFFLSLLSCIFFLFLVSFGEPHQMCARHWDELPILFRRERAGQVGTESHWESPPGLSAVPATAQGWAPLQCLSPSPPRHPAARHQPHPQGVQTRTEHDQCLATEFEHETNCQNISRNPAPPAGHVDVGVGFS